MLRHLHEQFNLPGHSGFLNGVSVSLLNETDPKHLTKREAYWNYACETKVPLGINVEDGLRRNYCILLKVH